MPGKQIHTKLTMIFVRPVSENLQTKWRNTRYTLQLEIWVHTLSSMRISMSVFLVIKNNAPISFIKEYKKPTLRSPCDDIDK